MFGFILFPAGLLALAGLGVALIAGIILSSLSAQLLMNHGFLYCRGWEGGVFMSSEVLFTAVIGQYQNATLPVPPNEAEKIGEAFYNRGLVRSYLGQYARAVADLTRAIALRPDETDWQQELQSAQRMSQDQEALRQQGAVANETQNVQNAGTP